jgi:hypothetical protein
MAEKELYYNPTEKSENEEKKNILGGPFVRSNYTLHDIHEKLYTENESVKNIDL